MTRPTTALLNAAHDQVNYWYDKAKKLDEELAKAEERIAELEARPIVVPAEKELPELLLSDYHESVGWNDAIREVRRMNAVASPLAVKLPAVPEGAEWRLAAAVELIKQAAPHMLADESLKDPGGALCGKVRTEGWSESAIANAITVMLDRIETIDPADDDRIEEVKSLVRHLASPAVPEYPEHLPCPVLLDPGLRLGAGIKTSTLLEALSRRAEYYARLEAMTPEEREEHDAGIASFKTLLDGAIAAAPKPE